MAWAVAWGLARAVEGWAGVQMDASRQGGGGCLASSLATAAASSAAVGDPEHVPVPVLRTTSTQSCRTPVVRLVCYAHK